MPDRLQSRETVRQARQPRPYLAAWLAGFQLHTKRELIQLQTITLTTHRADGGRTIQYSQFVTDAADQRIDAAVIAKAYFTAADTLQQRLAAAYLRGLLC